MIDAIQQTTVTTDRPLAAAPSPSTTSASSPSASTTAAAAAVPFAELLSSMVQATAATAATATDGAPVVPDGTTVADATINPDGLAAIDIGETAVEIDDLAPLTDLVPLLEEQPASTPAEDAASETARDAALAYAASSCRKAPPPAPGADELSSSRIAIAGTALPAPGTPPSSAPLPDVDLDAELPEVQPPGHGLASDAVIAMTSTRPAFAEADTQDSSDGEPEPSPLDLTTGRAPGIADALDTDSSLRIDHAQPSGTTEAGSANTSSRPIAASTSEGVLRSEHVKVLREMAPNREVQRLALDLDGARVSVSVGNEGARVNVLADPNDRLGGSWANDVSRSLSTTLRQSEPHPGTPGDRERRQRQNAYVPDDRRSGDSEFADRLGTTTTKGV